MATFQPIIKWSGSIVEIIDESCVKVCPVDGDRDRLVWVSEIKDKQ